MELSWFHEDYDGINLVKAMKLFFFSPAVHAVRRKFVGTFLYFLDATDFNTATDSATA